MLYDSNITFFFLKHSSFFYLLYCIVVCASAIYITTTEYLALTVTLENELAPERILWSADISGFER